MTREKFYKLCGWALILGPILFILGLWASSRPQYDVHNAAAIYIDRYANQVAVPLAMLGMVLISLGLVGLLMRYSPGLNGASILLGTSALAGLVSALGIAMLAVYDSDPWWSMFILGLGVQFLALAIFGLVNLRLRLFPRWNGLPVLALWFPVAMLLSLGLIPWEVSIQVFIGLWILTCVAFAGLGYLLVAMPQPPVKAAASSN